MSEIINKSASKTTNSNKFYVGVDVGGTSVKLGIFSENKKLLDKFAIDTVIRKSNNEKLLLNDIFEAIENYCKNNNYGVAKNKIIGIGFAVPGPVVDNQLLHAVNINWKKKYDIVKEIKNRYGKKIKVSVLNDANAAALGEYVETLKGKCNSMALITLGTAVGTGIIIDGKLVEGKTGIAGEISHIRVDYSDDAFKCSCGNVGCVETMAGSKGLINIYNRLKNGNTTNDIEENELNEEDYNEYAKNVINYLPMSEKLKDSISDELKNRVFKKIDMSDFSMSNIERTMISEMDKLFEEIINNESIKNEIEKIVKNGKIEDVITAKEIIDKAKDGDKIAYEAIDKSLDCVSRLIAILMHVYEPEVVVIGGGMSNAGTFITNIIEKHLKEKIFMTKTLPKIIIAKLKNDAGVVGAVERL